MPLTPPWAPLESPHHKSASRDAEYVGTLAAGSVNDDDSDDALALDDVVSLVTTVRPGN
jgi:hypothetical protein